MQKNYLGEKMSAIPEEALTKIENTLLRVLGCSYEIVGYEKTDKGTVAVIEATCDKPTITMDKLYASLVELEDIVSIEDSEINVLPDQRIAMRLKTKPLEELISKYE